MVPIRYLLNLMSVAGFFLLYSLRNSLNIAIVSMVNYTAPHSSNLTHYCPGGPLNHTSPQEPAGEFLWDEETQGAILSAFFYGYTLSQIPGGWVADRWGGKWVVGAGILATSLLTALIPPLAFLGALPVAALRALAGLAEGVTFPGLVSLLSNWTPQDERSTVIAATGVGATLGSIVTYPLAAALTSYPGWPSCFYIFGALGALWSLAWVLLSADTPEQHPWVTLQELSHIQDTRGRGKHGPVPWRQLLTSRVVWVLAATKFCSGWGFNTLQVELSSYLHSILHFSLSANGLLNSGLYLGEMSSLFVGALGADWLRVHSSLGITTIRKLFQTLACVVAASCMAAVPLAGCQSGSVATLFILAMTGYGLSSGGEGPLALDVCPAFAGIVTGVTNGLANVSGMVAPLVTGLLIQNQEDLEHWSRVFYIASGMYFLSLLVFLLGVRAEPESWALPESERTPLVDPQVC